MTLQLQLHLSQMTSMASRAECQESARSKAAWRFHRYWVFHFLPLWRFVESARLLCRRSSHDSEMIPHATFNVYREGCQPIAAFTLSLFNNSFAVIKLTNSATNPKIWFTTNHVRHVFRHQAPAVTTDSHTGALKPCPHLPGYTGSTTCESQSSGRLRHPDPSDIPPTSLRSAAAHLGQRYPTPPFYLRYRLLLAGAAVYKTCVQLTASPSAEAEFIELPSRQNGFIYPYYESTCSNIRHINLRR
jgi:hypothetical protein